MTGYELSREWFDWCFENPSKARPSHTAIYFWMIELCNRLGWKKEFGIPTLHSMEATGISSKNTYYKSFHDLENWGFIKIIEKAKNQNTPNIITIVGVLKIKSADIPADIPADKSALDSAMIQQVVQQEFSGGNIDKPLNNKTINKKQENEKSARAIEILKNIEEFQEYKNLMSSKITWRDLEISFNDKMDLELVQGKIKFIPSQLLPRLKLYANSWLNNETNNGGYKGPSPDSYESGKQKRV